MRGGEGKGRKGREGERKGREREEEEEVVLFSSLYSLHSEFEQGRYVYIRLGAQ